MADITPIASLNGELAMPEKVWMQGPPGPQGQQGEPGAAATVTVGTVTTGEPGTDAIVTNSGTESAAVLDFTIPRGETGTAGAGIPDGGTVGQLLGKTESGTAWIDPPQSGASSSEVFIIHATTDETYTNAQVDKTTEQIYEAYQSGKYCLVRFEGKFFPVVSVETYSGGEASLLCFGLTINGDRGIVVSMRFETADGATWAFMLESPMLYNVCFYGLKIYGADDRVYTISVDVDGNLTATAAT